MTESAAAAAAYPLKASLPRSFSPDLPSVSIGDSKEKEGKRRKQSFLRKIMFLVGNREPVWKIFKRAELKLVNKAISLACPYVADDARLPEDYRHECDPPIKPATKAAQAHSLWAFAHLTEALAFHSVLTYSTIDSSDKTNLEIRAERLESADVSDPRELPSFLKKIDELTDIVDKVMPTSGFCSEEYPQAQFSAMINDLLAVSAAFENLEGIPDSLTKSIDKSMESVKEIRDNAGNVDSSAQQASSARGDFTKEIASSVSEQLEQIPAGSLSEEETEELCSSYQGLLGDDATLEDTPDLCD